MIVKRLMPILLALPLSYRCSNIALVTIAISYIDCAMYCYIPIFNEFLQISAEVRAEFKQMVPLFDPSLVVFPPTLIDVVPCPANKTSQTTVPFNAPTACGLPANYTPVTSPPTTPPQPHGNGSGKGFNITFMA